MRCDEIRKLLEPYFDGEAAPDSRAAVDGHLPRCDACRESLEQLRLVWQALDADPEPPWTPLRADGILRRARARERRVVALRVGVAAAAVAILGVALWTAGVFEAGDGGGDDRTVVRQGGAPTAGDLPGDVDDDLLRNLDLLQDLSLEDLEVIENLDLIENLPPELLNGSESG